MEYSFSGVKPLLEDAVAPQGWKSDHADWEAFREDQIALEKRANLFERSMKNFEQTMKGINIPESLYDEAMYAMTFPPNHPERIRFAAKVRHLKVYWSPDIN